MRAFIIVAIMSWAAVAGAKPPAANIRIASQRALDETSLSVGAVVAKVQAQYLAGIKGCYQKRLAKVADASGDLSLAFAVDPKGRTKQVTASGLDGVDACVA